MNVYCQPCTDHGLMCSFIIDEFITPEYLFARCCKFFQVTPKRIMNRSRERPFITYRQMIQSFIYCTFNGDKSLKAIGELTSETGAKPYDHTTITNSIQTIKNLCETNEHTRLQYRDLKRFVLGG